MEDYLIFQKINSQENVLLTAFIIRTYFFDTGT
jgi:hypothetical protein